MKGKFITFEGSEGSGKSTQSRLLYEYLRKRVHRVLYLREPGGTLIAEKIRSILLDCKNHAMLPECEMLLYMAARAQVAGEIIRPALKKGKIVICDRFLDSTIAYQGFGLGIDIKFIKSVGLFTTYGIEPDLTVFLDLPVKKGLKHRKAKKDRIEKRSFAYHNRVRKGYLELARLEAKRIKVIKVCRDKEKTQLKIRDALRSHVLQGC